MKRYAPVLILLLVITFILFAGCNKNTQHLPIPHGDTDVLSVDPNKPPPRGETHETGHWTIILWRGDGFHNIDWWVRTTPFDEYDDIGIPKKFPVDENGNSYIGTYHLPEHLYKRLSEVNSKHNHDNTPEHHQDIYDALCGHLKPKDAVKFFITYNEYNAVAVKHMDDYQAFKYIVRTTQGINVIGADASEYAQRIFEKKPKTKQGYEAGMYLRRYKDVLKYHPNDANALYRVGRSLSDEKPEDAIEYLKRADKYEHKSRWHDTIALTYQKLNDRENALYHFKESLRLDPLNFQYIGNLLKVKTGREWDEGMEAAYHAYLAEVRMLSYKVYSESIEMSGEDVNEHIDTEMNIAINFIREAIQHHPNEPVWQDKLQDLLNKKEKLETDGYQIQNLILSGLTQYTSF